MENIMKQAVEAYWSIVNSDEFKEIERVREIARREERKVLVKARREGIRKERLEMAQRMKDMDIDADTIIKVTKLTKKSVEEINH